MIDVVDEISTIVSMVLQSSQALVWSLALHRMLPLALFFAVCTVALFFTSWAQLELIQEVASNNQARYLHTNASKTVDMDPWLRGYLVTRIRVDNVSTSETPLLVTFVCEDALGNVIDDAGTALCRDVQAGIVNCIVLGGTIWHVRPNPSSWGSLLLDEASLTHTTGSFPILPIRNDSASWVRGWGRDGASALVFAFND